MKALPLIVVPGKISPRPATVAAAEPALGRLPPEEPGPSQQNHKIQHGQALEGGRFMTRDLELGATLGWSAAESSAVNVTPTAVASILQALEPSDE